MTHTVQIPTEVELSLVMPNFDDDTIKAVAEFLYIHSSKTLEKEIPYFKLDVKPGDGEILFNFSGVGMYYVTPGTMATWDYPGDPDEIEYPFSIDTFKDYVKDEVKSVPEYLGADAIKSDAYLKDNLDVLDSTIPDDDEICAELDRKLYSDDYIDEAVSAVISGKSLSEAVEIVKRKGLVK